jgi:DNA-binding CsgD family transcriptional regulator
LLTRRQREVVALLVLGNSNRKTADILGLSVKTIETYRARVMQKLGLPLFAHLVVYAVHMGFVI